jgi:hypothetical protein
MLKDKKKALEWKKKFNYSNFNPKLIFKTEKTKESLIFSLGFFVMVMASEILFNQPFKNKIGVIHNKVFKVFFNKRFEKIERIENTAFSFSLFLILNKLYKEDDTLESQMKEVMFSSICHWSSAMNFNEKEYARKVTFIEFLYEKNKKFILTHSDEALIDLIFLLYKSFEIGEADKKIIQKNIAVLGFSVSKAMKEFRYDALNEFKDKFSKFRY